MQGLSGLKRTLKTRYVPYPPDGSGRDRYIAYNNGGFFNKNNTFNSNQNNKQTGTAFDTKIDYKFLVSPSVKVPSFHYHGDGTGRDSYIMSNGGGLFYDSKSLSSYKLIDFLRRSEPNYIKHNNLDNRVSLSQLKYIKALREKEKALIERLYEKEKNKRKLIKVDKNEENDNENENLNENNELPVISTSKSSTLPKVFNNRGRSCTETNMKDLNELNENEDNKKNEDEEKLNSLNTISHSTLNRNYTVSNEHLMKNFKRLTKYEDKKNKKDNLNFAQAYFHLRNVNYNTISV